MTGFDAATDELPPDVTLVTPTRRLAHHLRTRHDAACVARGLLTWRTPDVVTWNELLQRQFTLDRAAGRTLRKWLPVAHARLAWEHLVRRDAKLAAVLAPAGLGAVAYRSWTLLHQYRIPDTALASAESVETAAFAGWVDRYRAWLDEGGWLDPALASTVVGPFAADVRLQFAGFDRVTPEQSTFIARLAGQRIVVADVPACDQQQDVVAAEVVHCNDAEAELETAARWAAHWLEKQPQARLALVVPALDRERPRVRRTLDRILVPAVAATGGPAPESQAYELATARPLTERSVVAAALAWLDASSGRPGLPTTLGALLLGPHDGAADAEAMQRAALDVDLRRTAMPVRGLGSVAHEARRFGCKETARQFEQADVRGRSWHGSRLPSVWAQEFAGLLWDIGWPGADPGSTEHQAVQRWQALLAEFGASDDVAGPVRAHAALGYLRELAGSTSFEPQEIAAPLLVIDPQTALGMRFDALWVCGLDAAHWPAPASPDPFLPREWQTRQQLPGATAQLAEADARRTLDRLCRAAPVVVCSVPRFKDEAPLLPSALVADLPCKTTLDLWGGNDAARVMFEARPALDTLLDGTLPAFAAHDVVKGGTRLLELQAACPFRAAVELRLGGKKLEEPQSGIAPNERGRLVHTVLQAFWLGVPDHAALVALSAELLAARVAGLVEQTLAPLRATGDDVRGRLLDLEQRWLEARVLELLAQDAAREPFTVVHVEDPRTVDVGGVQVRVVLDRVDRLADGSYVFIDYKTGRNANPAAWMGERPELPQLPLYARTANRDEVSAIAFGNVRKGGTRYSGYSRVPGLFSALQPFNATRAEFRDYADWKALLLQWERRLDALAREHATGDARLAPNPSKACRHCHLPGLCRTGQAFIEAEEGDDAAE